MGKSIRSKIVYFGCKEYVIGRVRILPVRTFEMILFDTHYVYWIAFKNPNDMINCCLFSFIVCMQSLIKLFFLVHDYFEFLDVTSCRMPISSETTFFLLNNKKDDSCNDCDQNNHSHYNSNNHCGINTRCNNLKW